MKLRLSLTIALGVLAVQGFAPAIALADAAPAIEATPVPRPAKPDFSTLNFLLGTWSCSEKSARRPTPDTWTQTASLDPSGYWLVTKSTDAGTSWFPYPSTSTDSVTYDSDSKQWVDLYLDTNGGYGYSTSTGWSGNTIVWTDRAFVPTANIKSISNFTLVKVSDTKTTSERSFVTSKGTTVGVSGSCTKQ